MNEDMKKKNWLRLLESCAFLVLLLAVFAGVSRLVERKESSNQFGPFIKEPEQYDVLFFGDSRFVNAMFPMELWADYGIPGYNLSCYGSTMPICYWSMINALDYGKPEVVVIAANGVRKDIKLTGSSEDLHSALDFFPLSLNKARAIEDLMDDPEMKTDEGARYVDLKWEYYFTIGKYHTRWSQLKKSDYAPVPGVQKGAEAMAGVADEEDYDIIDSDMYAEESGAGYRYMRMMIEECQSRGIDVLLVHLPFPASEDSQMHGNTVSSIAEEYGIGYIDFVQMDSVVDYAVDCYDQQSHLNISGGQKVTDYIGRYLMDHYQLADRRGDAAYAPWQTEQERYVQYKRELLAGEDSLDNLLLLLHDDQFSARIAVRENADFYWDDKLYTLMHNTQREHVYEEDSYSKWSNSMFPLTTFDDAAWDGTDYFLELDRANDRVLEAMGEEAAAKTADVFGAWQEGMEAMIEITDSLTGEVLVSRQF